MKSNKYITFSLLTFLAVLQFGCSNYFQLNQIKSQYYAIGDSLNSFSDSSISADILPYQLKVKQLTNEELIYNNQLLSKGGPNSLLGIYCADACYRACKQLNEEVDFVVLNNGGLRNPLPQGMINVGMVYELMPFENELVILKLDSMAMNKLIAYIINKGNVPISGIRLQINDQKVSSITINGVPYDNNKQYLIATSDYLANGGDQMLFFKDIAQKKLNLKIRNLLINDLRQICKTEKQLTIKNDFRYDEKK